MSSLEVGWVGGEEEVSGGKGHICIPVADSNGDAWQKLSTIL